MLKSFCDICSKEILLDSLSGGMMRKKRTYPMLPLGPKGTMIAGRRDLDEIWELCEDCQKWLWEFADKKHEEFLKKKISAILQP